MKEQANEFDGKEISECSEDDMNSLSENEEYASEELWDEEELMEDPDEGFAEEIESIRRKGVFIIKNGRLIRIWPPSNEEEQNPKAGDNI